MDQQVFLKQCIQALQSAVAIVNPETGAIEFENAKFFQWFPPVGEPDAPLVSRLPGIEQDKFQRRLDRGRPFTLDFELKDGAKTVSVALRIRRETIDDRDVLIAEGQDVTKQLQAEYMLDSYSRMAEKNSRELAREKERVEKLLLNVMPRSVYEEMKDYGTTTPQRFDSATVLMLDFVGFTDMAISRDPSALIGELNDIFSAFDRIAELFGCERLKTIGDAYMAVSGLPETTADHAVNVAKLAVRMRRYLEKRNDSHPTQWECRIGIATGPVIGSIVGIQKYVYDVFGPAVNLCARLEAMAAPMQILVSGETRDLVHENFEIAERGDMELKGFGLVDLYSIEYEKSQR